MKHEIDFTAVLDILEEGISNTASYYEACQNYKRKYGGYAYFGCGETMSAENRNIIFAEKWKTASEEAIDAIGRVLNLDYDQKERLYIAGRAIHRWYNMTNWERCPDWKLVERLERFVMYNKGTNLVSFKF